MALNIPGLNSSMPITADGKSASLMFLTWFNNLVTSITAATNANTTAIALIQAQQAQTNAILAQLQSAQATATQAQTTADSGSGARSGNASTTMTLIGSGWVTGPTVSLLTVSAGNLTIFGSGPQQQNSTGVTPPGLYSGNWRVIENPGAVVVFNGTYTAESYYDSEFGGSVVIFYINDDLSSVSIARATTGSIDYTLEVEGVSGVTTTNLLAYLNVRRS